MPRIKDVYTYVPKEGDYLTPTEKKEWIKSKRTVTITDIDQEVGKYGPMWVFSVVFEDTGEQRKYSHQQAPWFDDMAEPMFQHFINENEPFTNIRLVEFETKEGQHGQMLVDADDVDQEEELPFS